MRTFVPCLIIASLLVTAVAADAPKQSKQTKPGTTSPALYRPDEDKVKVIHPVYRPGIDKFQIIHPIYRPGIDKFEVRNLGSARVLTAPKITKQTTITSTYNISEKTIKSAGSVKPAVPPLKNERGSSGCAKKGQRSSK